MRGGKGGEAMTGAHWCASCGRPRAEPRIDGAIVDILDGVLQCVCAEPGRNAARYVVQLRAALWDATYTLNGDAAALLEDALTRLNERRWDEEDRRAVWNTFDAFNQTIDRIEHLDAVALYTHGPKAVARVLRLVKK
jgi:hypothetical protein